MQNQENDGKNNASNILLKRMDLGLPDPEFNETIAKFTKAIEQDPQDASSYLCRGMAYSKVVIYGKLIQAFNKGIDELDAENANVNDNQHTAQLLDSYCDKAIQDFIKTIELDPVNPIAYELRGRMHLHKGQYDAAIADCTKAIELDAKNLEAYEGRAMAHFRNNHLEEAWSDVEACQRRNRDVNPEFLAALYKASEEPDGR